MVSEYLSAFLSTVFSIPSLVIIFLVIVIRIAVSTDWYKKFFAKMESNSAQLLKGIMAPLKQKIFVELGQHLKEVEGDVLEIGIGAGENFDLYPEGTSLIAVDSNPHVEELLTENLKKAGERVHLKKFVLASAEDMSCSLGKPGVEDNSVAAVVCTMVLCSLTDDQTTKTLAEVKRVLMPGGRFFFLEHVAGKPWTLQYFVQHLLTKLLIYPTLFNGCRCNKETLASIKQADFKTVQAEKGWLQWSSEAISTPLNPFTFLLVRSAFAIVNSGIAGFAEK
ncbi:unnamed protein product [Porites evermanni]|uniref:Methyltransferase type 11 domain-containing protein n=1 Tax=Porites evermanni TaxID=104178 RepID=A0ABN8SND1_9CNID|nr:unnamed protein product [Porites evermanni]